MEIKKTQFQIEIIHKIKEHRLRKNVSQAHISDLLGLHSNGLVGNIESPRYSHKYTLKHLYTLADKLDFPIETLFLSDEELKQEQNIVIDNLIKKIIEYDG